MKQLLTILIAVSLFSCKDESKVEEAVAQIPVEFKVERFDQILFNSNPSDFSKIKSKFPEFFPETETDSFWVEFMKDSLYKEVSSEVKIKYPDNLKLENEISNLLKYVKYYFPNSKDPRVITLVSRVDVENSAIYNEQKNIILIGLDCYLGKDHRYYADFPNFKKELLEENQILPNLVSSFCYGKIAAPTDRTLLSAMIYYGKELYMKDKLIPEYSDADKMGYTDLQLKFCQENEYYMWSNLVENKLLYDSNPKNEQRFINPAPFSKFYLEMDNQIPGRVGQWLGWQIVRSYMENNEEVTLQELLAMDAKTIFENSKYKPKKQ